MGEAKRRKALDKGFGKSSLTVEFGGEMVRGDEVGFPEFAHLLPFVAEKDGRALGGFVIPTIGEKKQILVRWMCLKSDFPKAKAAQILKECGQRYNRKAGEVVRAHIQQADSIIIVDGEPNV